MLRYFLGIDVGGSKSHALIADESGQVVGFGQAGTGNHEVIGYTGLSSVLHQITDQAVAKAGIRKDQIAGYGLGLAGYDWPVDHQPHHDVIVALGIPAPFEFVNDAVIGLIAGASEGWGISVVAGTGNNCRGRDKNGREGRVAGTGYWTGEHGGGGDLVVRAMQAVSKSWSMRGPETILTQKFLDHLGAQDVMDILEGLSRGRFTLGASASRLVFEAADQGDEIARDVICWMGRELASLAIGVIRQLKFEPLDFEIVLTGSLYKGSPLIESTMRETIHEVAPDARFVPLNAPPVVGAVLLGMEQIGLKTPEVRSALIEGANALLIRSTPD